MEKETKRAFQNILEILKEQQELIHVLQQTATARRRSSDDGVENRIQRIAKQVGDRDAFEIDWARLCDRHYAKRC